MDPSKHLEVSTYVLIGVSNRMTLLGMKKKRYIHKWIIGSMIVFLALFVEDILLNQNEITTLQGIRSGCHLSSP